VRTLGEIRGEIDEIDLEIVDLLARRSELARDALEAKDDGRQAPARDAGREDSIVAAMLAAHQEAGGLYPEGTISRVWYELFAGSQRLRRR
jgi:chorismate mutase